MGEKSEFRISALEVEEVPRGLLKVIGPPLDWLLGIRRIRRIYEKSGLAGLEKYLFLERFLQKYKIRYEIPPGELERIPGTGPLIIIANHPLGGLEGIILAYILRKIRRDYKFLVNIVLSVIKELKDFWICVNNNIPYSKGTFKAISECKCYLAEGHCLVLFPAGRVGVYDPAKGYVTDEKWNNISSSLVALSRADVVPVYINGSSSTFFSMATRIFYPAKLMLLGWEFLNSLNKKVRFFVGRPISNRTLRKMTRKQSNAYMRMRTYLLAGAQGHIPRVPSASRSSHKGSFPSVMPRELLEMDLRRLPGPQHLFSDDTFEVCYGYVKQVPHLMIECEVLRHPEEGAIYPERDFAALSMLKSKSPAQLFIWDKKLRRLCAACRVRELHENPEIPEEEVPEQGRDYGYGKSFLASFTPGLELSDFFFIPEYLPAPVCFRILGSGLGEFMLSAGYRYLCGSIPVDPGYTPASLGLIDYALTGRRREVSPVLEMRLRLHPEVEEYINKYGFNLRELDNVIPALEDDGKGVPALLKMVYRLGARFLGAGWEGEKGNVPSFFFLLEPAQSSSAALIPYLGKALSEKFTRINQPVAGSDNY